MAKKTKNPPSPTAAVAGEIMRSLVLEQLQNLDLKIDTLGQLCQERGICCRATVHKWLGGEFQQIRVGTAEQIAVELRITPERIAAAFTAAAEE